MAENIKVGDVIISISVESSLKNVKAYGRVYHGDIVKIIDTKDSSEGSFFIVDRLWFIGYKISRYIEINKLSSFMIYGYKIQDVPHDTIRLIFDPIKFRAKISRAGHSLTS